MVRMMRMRQCDSVILCCALHSCADVLHTSRCDGVLREYIVCATAAALRWQFSAYGMDADRLVNELLLKDDQGRPLATCCARTHVASRQLNAGVTLSRLKHRIQKGRRLPGAFCLDEIF